MINMVWKDILKEDWPQYIQSDGKRYLLFKVIGDKGTYRNPDVEKDVYLTIQEANEQKYYFPSSGGFARHYQGSDPRSRYNR